MSGEAPRPIVGRFDITAFLFNAAGRSGRTAYLVGVAAAGVLMKSTLLLPIGWARIAWACTVGFVGFVIWGVLTARRLHDLGLAGWWFAVPAGLMFFTADRLSLPQTPLQWSSGAIVAGLTIALLLWPGQRDFNRFGPRPR